MSEALHKEVIALREALRQAKIWTDLGQPLQARKVIGAALSQTPDPQTGEQWETKAASILFSGDLDAMRAPEARAEIERRIGPRPQTPNPQTGTLIEEAQAALDDLWRKTDSIRDKDEKVKRLSRATRALLAAYDSQTPNPQTGEVK